jgi:hypothetical protein
MKRMLREDKLLETVEKIHKRLHERFPDSGLSHVAAEIVQITREALVRAAAIRRPNVLLRSGLVLLLLIALVGIITYFNSEGHKPFLQALLDFLDAAKGSAAILTALAVFFITLETRLKRRRALQAVHELRAIAHIIDMHQLAKDPDLLGHPTEPITISEKPADADSLRRYLHYSTELLAVVSKIGQVYVQDFPDATAQTAVDNFETLATGLSSKIWQKLMILDRIRSDKA